MAAVLALLMMAAVLALYQLVPTVDIGHCVRLHEHMATVCIRLHGSFGDDGEESQHRT